ncbi:hypothetical protein BTUL_0163g00200 [Botrytis tulipae]|uniref:Heterokaryon incompatibility domain-containing protein n=1 Tax=Botrytis tulipae TaxID=87230 RepID=A0A4Z1EDE9_9HELO|nr:hypothetical protein BTUL_0163g00200 [Botrytis tulipae]
MECKSGLRCECTGLEQIYETSRSKLPALHSLDPGQILDRWLALVNEYSALRITYNEDRLVALSGVAEDYQDRLGSHYLAGIWLSDLARGLLWDAKKNFPFVEKDDPKMVVNSLTSSEPWYLTVRGLTVIAKLIHGYHRRAGNYTMNDTTLEFNHGRKFRLGFVLDVSPSQYRVRSGDEVCCLLVGTSDQVNPIFGHERTPLLYIIVCKIVENSGNYERLGVCTGRLSTQIVKSFREKTLTLV